MNRVTCASFLAGGLLAVAPVFAATELSYYNSDTRYNSAATPDAFASPGDANPGSLKYSTGTDNGTGPDGRNKVAVTFFSPDGAGTGTPAGAALGTIGTLNQLSFDYYLSSSTIAANSTLAPAVRLKLSPNGTASATYVDLVWENVYNNPGASPKDAWQNDVNVFAGTQWWQRSNGVNHDGAPDFRPFADFVNGYTPTFNGPGVTLNANTPIYGVEISIGSGLPNSFEAYIDDVKLGFSNGTSYASNVPEPTSLAVLGLGAVGLLRRRKNV